MCDSPALFKLHCCTSIQHFESHFNIPWRFHFLILRSNSMDHSLDWCQVKSSPFRWKHIIIQVFHFMLDSNRITLEWSCTDPHLHIWYLAIRIFFKYMLRDFFFFFYRTREKDIGDKYCWKDKWEMKGAFCTVWTQRHGRRKRGCPASSTCFCVSK